MRPQLDQPRLLRRPSRPQPPRKPQREGSSRHRTNPTATSLRRTTRIWTHQMTRMTSPSPRRRASWTTMTTISLRSSRVGRRANRRRIGRTRRCSGRQRRKMVSFPILSWSVSGDRQLTKGGSETRGGRETGQGQEGLGLRIVVGRREEGGSGRRGQTPQTPPSARRTGKRERKKETEGRARK